MTCCSKIPPSEADYIALANAKHTMALSGVPIFNASNRQVGCGWEACFHPLGPLC